MNRKLVVQYFFLVFYIVVPIVLLLLPSNFFDSGPDICISKLLLHRECIGCGLTRGIQHLIHFDFTSAYSFNKLSFIVFPVLATFWARVFFKDVQYIRQSKKSSK